jgi:acyl-CoA thioesterase
MARMMGFDLVETGRARALTRFVPGPDHLTVLNRVQGGALLAQADHAIAIAAGTLGGTVVTVELKINFLAPARAGDVILAEARAVDIKRKLSLWQAEVRREGGELLAVVQGMLYHARDKSYADDDPSGSASAEPRENIS